MDWKDLDRLRNPGFSFGRRGYDRHEVDRFLEQLVNWLETDAARDLGHVAITRKLELVGKSTTHVLLAAEQEAEELLRQAEADIAELRKQAEGAAGTVRALEVVLIRATSTPLVQGVSEAATSARPGLFQVGVADHVDVARAKRRDLAGLRVVGVAPDAARVVREQVDRDRCLG